MTVIYAKHLAIRNDYLVRERDRRRLHELLLMSLALVPLVLALFFYTWVNLGVLRVGSRIDSLERELHGLERRGRQLDLEVSRLASPARIETLARNELGMEVPATVVFHEEVER